MGSFAYTCTVSGLPIEAGDKVRYLLLTQNPYTHQACSMHDVWFPRTFPIKAEYDDYGSVDLVQEGPQRDLWMDTLKLDLVEVGTGDNPCHDSSTAKDMSFNALLTALVEQRVKVLRNFGYKGIGANIERHAKSMGLQDPDDIHPVGFPTLNRIRKVLKQKKLPLYAGDYGKPAYMVDAPEIGVVRIRWHAYEYAKKIKALKRVQQHFTEYASVIVAGSNLNGGPDLMLFIPPGTKNKDGHFTTSYNEDSEVPLVVQSAMIREDVWQALLQLPLSINMAPSYKRKNVDIQYFRDDARRFWRLCVAKVAKDQKWKAEMAQLGGKKLAKTETEVGTEAFQDSFHMLGSDNVVGAWVHKDEIPFTVGWGTQWSTMFHKHKMGKLPEKDLSDFLDVVAESCFVSLQLMPIRYWWRPSYSCGPQFGEYKKHSLALEAFAAIATKLGRKRKY